MCLDTGASGRTNRIEDGLLEVLLVLGGRVSVNLVGNRWIFLELRHSGTRVVTRIVISYRLGLHAES